MKGESVREKAKTDILWLLSQRQDSRFNDVYTPLKDKYAKNTFIKYLKELVKDGLVKRALSGAVEDSKIAFSITPKGKKSLLDTMMEVNINSARGLLELGDAQLLIENTREYHKLLRERFAKDISGNVYICIGEDGKVDIQPEERLKRGEK